VEADLAEPGRTGQENLKFETDVCRPFLRVDSKKEGMEES